MLYRSDGPQLSTREAAEDAMPTPPADSVAMVVVYVMAMRRADARLKQVLGADSHHGAPPPPPGSVLPAATPATPAAPAPFRRR